MDLKAELSGILRDKTLIAGVGNPDRADDGFGPFMISRLAENGWKDILDAGTTPEKIPAVCSDAGYENVLLMDAVSTGVGAGNIVLMNAEKIDASFPQVSTHRISLGTIASMIAQRSACKVWLLGLEPEDTSLSSQMSATVKKTVELLLGIFSEIRT
jgi:hydrogenase maturation protease